MYISSSRTPFKNAVWTSRWWMGHPQCPARPLTIQIVLIPFYYKSKGFGIIKPCLLLEPLGNCMSLVMIILSINSRFNSKKPLACDGLFTKRKRNK